jgi:hypothetical protein
MDIIKPLTVTDAMLTSSTITEDDYAAYVPATTYVTDDYVVVADSGIHKIYKSGRDANTGNYPPDNIYDGTASPVTGWWIEVSATNRWRMFDRKTKSVSSDSGQVIVALTPGVLCNAVALMNVEAAVVNITVTEPTEGEIYNEDISLVDNSEIYDIYTWCFTDLSRKPIAVVTNLSAYPASTITISAADTGNTVEIGELIIGTVKYVGQLLYGYSVGISDYSVKETDPDTGSVSVTVGQYSDTGKFKVRIPKPMVSYIKRLLASLRATPLVFIGCEEEGFQETIIYGLPAEFNASIPNIKQAYHTIEIEEFI